MDLVESTEMTLKIPEWLDEKFIHACLEDGKKNGEVTVKSYETSTVAPPGNGFLSLLVRVKVKYQKKNSEDVQNLSLVVKGPLGEMSSFYETEPKFYKMFMSSALEISPDIRFAPKTYFSPVPGVIVLEDLKSECYLMAEKNEMLDYAHCRLYAIASATFHAVAVAVHEKYPTLVQSLGSEKFFSNEPSSVGIRRLFVGGLRHLAKKMKDFEEYKKYADIIHSSSTAIWNMTVDVLKPNATFNSLTQGDPWVTNMMFKYDSSRKPVEVKLLDFQGLRYSSPVVDLIFFIWSSPKHEVREKRLTDFYRVYCDTLNDKLEDYNCSERFSYEQLMEAVKRLSCKALFVASTSFPIMMCQKNIDAGTLCLEECDERKFTGAFDQYYDHDYCKNHLPKLLKQLDTLEVFENVITQLGLEKQ
uniref:CHK kinase-like domain-containing protein n=2 Tax=Graphocephala atropunctata TaxID=36148 RepID=A0A1B6LHD9_9HEMI